MAEQRQNKILCRNKIIRLETGSSTEQHSRLLVMVMDNPSQGAISENAVSAAELKIRDELEADIEEDLEREIIDDMCRLARHLQRLYQHKDRREFNGSANNYQLSLSHTENPVLSEVNIRIKLDGQCRIDITKVQQDVAAIQPKSCPESDTEQSDKKQGSMKTKQSHAANWQKQQNYPVAPWR
ncbi:hypothetical protein ACP4OV_010798 [Aristida adscensionis]